MHMLPHAPAPRLSSRPFLRTGLLSRWVFSGPWAVAHAALACLVLLRLYPRPAAHTPSFEFSTSFMGAMFGIVVGTAMTPAAHQPGIQVSASRRAGAPAAPH